VLDLWFERVVKSRLRGEAYLVRYIDDFVVCFQYREDALRVQEALRKRLGKFGLTLEPRARPSSSNSVALPTGMRPREGENVQRRSISWALPSTARATERAISRWECVPRSLGFSAVSPIYAT